jgi:integrase
MKLLNDENPEMSTSSPIVDKGIEKSLASSIKKEIEHFSEAEVKAILSTIHLEEKRLLFLLGLNLGGRASEIATPSPKPDKEKGKNKRKTPMFLERCGVRWRNINFKDEHLVIWDEKKNQYRVCQLDKNTWEALKDYSKREDVIKGKRHDDRVFPYSTRTINRYLKEIAKAAGIDRPVHWHMLRHSFVIHSRRAGRDWKFISQQTGDKVSTLMETYSGYSLEERQEIIDKHPLLGGLI